MDWIPPKSPLIHGLFVRRPLSNLLLRFVSFFCRAKQNTPIPTKPKKILVCNIANLGDVVISTAVLPVLKKKYPDSEIGFLTSNASAIVVQNHPLVNRVHCYDHWFFHRKIPKYKAAIQSPKNQDDFWGPLGKSKCKAALHLKKELKQAGYDIAIDLYSYFPNTIPLLAECGIPVRIGYPSGGFGRLLTHPVEWNFADRYVGDAHLQLLKPLGVDVSKESPLPFYNFKKATQDYVVVHMGSLQPLKEWIPEKWIALIRRLKADREKVILTGKGEREGTICKQVAEATGAEDRSNRLNWEEFVSTVQEARLLISVDSVAVHVAAGSLTPTVELFTGMNSPYMWVPPYPLHKTVMKRVSCAPCFQKGGCPAMTCIKEIEIEECYLNARKLLEERYARC